MHERSPGPDGCRACNALTDRAEAKRQTLFERMSEAQSEWLDISTLGSRFELQLLTKPGGGTIYRHRERGEIVWVSGRP